MKQLIIRFNGEKGTFYKTVEGIEDKDEILEMKWSIEQPNLQIPIKVTFEK